MQAAGLYFICLLCWTGSGVWHFGVLAKLLGLLMFICFFAFSQVGQLKLFLSVTLLSFNCIFKFRRCKWSHVLSCSRSTILTTKLCYDLFYFFFKSDVYSIFKMLLALWNFCVLHYDSRVFLSASSLCGPSLSSSS